MARMQRSLFAQLNALADEISKSPVKTAAEKAAGPTPSDPGGYAGASSHPSASVDNDVQAATEGARSSEYEADIKKQQGVVGVNSTPELPQEGRQDDVQLNINTNAAATGEDPAAEKDYKGTKDDPGTTHPAKTNDGEKYSAVTFKEARDRAGALGNDILANIINFGAGKFNGEKAAEMPAFLKAKMNKDENSEKKDDDDDDDDDDHDSDESKKPSSEHDGLTGNQHKLDVNNNGKIEGSDLAALRNGQKAAAFNAGYELASVLGLSKEAAEASVREVCANTIREADEMADLFIGFATSKMAAADPTDAAAEGEDHSAPSDVGSGASDAPAGLEAMMGGDGAGMEEAMPMEAAGPEAGAGGSDEAVQELAMALEELGIPPEALIQALSQGGGAEGAAAPEAAPMEAAPKMAAAALDAIGREVVSFKRAGRFQVKEARTKRSRELRDSMKQHVIELLNR